jgi:hypothetical protein
MASTYTTNLRLAKPGYGDEGWNVSLDNNRDILDALSPVGGLVVTTAEQPSASLDVRVAPGNYVKQDGSIGSYAGTSSQAIATASTKVLYLDGAASWVLTVGASYPATPHIRLATVVAGASTITSITDQRQCFPVVGSIADGTVLTLGTAAGLKIGSVATEKLALWGKTPVVQQTGGAATAGGTYTSAEQDMLNKLWAMARTIGLLS